MKPRNKYQENIVALSAQLPYLNRSQIEYAKDNVFPLFAYRNKVKGWCTHCGSSLRFDKEASSSHITCPHCGKRLEVKTTGERKYKFRGYYTVVMTFKGFQVVRHFFCTMKIRKGCSPEYEIDEVVQNWIDTKGKETILARSTVAMTGFYDYWNMSSELSIKHRQGHYHYYGSRYDIDNTTYYPHAGLLKEVRRNGLTSLKEFESLPINRLLSAVLSDRETELLLKHKQHSLITHKIRTGYPKVASLKHPEAVRIANRHRYIVNDASLWIDYISTCKQLGLDVHNPHYACPANLQEAHDRVFARKRRQDAIDNRKKKAAEAKEYEQTYRDAKAPYFGIVFGDENIVITVVKSVAEMAEEGGEMHHCVFDMKYYAKENSLILSAKDKEGNRIETIEVNLETFKVVQSRGVCNGNSPYHDRILQLMEENMHLIKKAA